MARNQEVKDYDGINCGETHQRKLQTHKDGFKFMWPERPEPDSTRRSLFFGELGGTCSEMWHSAMSHEEAFAPSVKGMNPSWPKYTSRLV